MLYLYVQQAFIVNPLLFFLSVRAVDFDMHSEGTAESSRGRECSTCACKITHASVNGPVARHLAISYKCLRLTLNTTLQDDMSFWPPQNVLGMPIIHI